MNYNLPVQMHTHVQRYFTTHFKIELELLKNSANHECDKIITNKIQVIRTILSAQWLIRRMFLKIHCIHMCQYLDKTHNESLKLLQHLKLTCIHFTLGE